jgi:hypothetical protein
VVDLERQWRNLQPLPFLVKVSFLLYFVQGSPLGSFEIGSLQFLRSQAYLDYFNYLDKAGGFSYERWGDAVGLNVLFACAKA